MTENTKKTEAELFDKMLAVANEQAALDVDMKELLDEAKSLGYDAALMKKIAVAKAQGKVEDVVEKAECVIAAAEKYA